MKRAFLSIDPTCVSKISPWRLSMYLMQDSFASSVTCRAHSRLQSTRWTAVKTFRRLAEAVLSCLRNTLWSSTRRNRRNGVCVWGGGGGEEEHRKNVRVVGHQPGRERQRQRVDQLRLVGCSKQVSSFEGAGNAVKHTHAQDKASECRGWKDTQHTVRCQKCRNTVSWKPV